MARPKKDLPSPPVKRLNINVEEKLHQAFKIAAAARGENMTDVLLDFIRDYVARNLPKELRRKL